MKRPRRLLAIVVGVLVVLLLAKNLLTKIAVTQGVKAVTGLRMTIDDLDGGFLKTDVRVQGLKLLNPPGFEDPVMVEIPELYVDYNLGSILRGTAHVESMRLHLLELVVIRNREGELNLNALNPVKASKGETPTEPETKKPAKPPKIQIDHLALNIGNVLYKDYTSSPPQARVFSVNIREEFRDITNLYALGSLILTRALSKTAIARLTSFDLGALQSQVTDLLSTQAGAVTKGVTDAVKGVEGVGKDTVDSAGNAVRETTDALKKLLPVTP